MINDSELPLVHSINKNTYRSWSISPALKQGSWPAKLFMEDTRTESALPPRHSAVASVNDLPYRQIRIREDGEIQNYLLLTIGQIEDSSVAASPAAGLGFAATDPVY